MLSITSSGTTVFTMVNDSHFVVCRLCNRQLRILSTVHLVTHGITRDEYLEKFDLYPEALVSTDWRVRVSRRPDYVPYRRKDVERELRSIFRKHGNVGAAFVLRRWPVVYVQALNLYGGWEKALKSLGLESWKMEMRREWTAERVLSEIRRLYRKNGHAKCNQDAAGALQFYARYHHGNWRAAVKAAGISAKDANLREFWSKETVSKFVRMGRRRASMSKSEFTRFDNACRKHFGSIEAALASEGRTWTEFFGIRRWSREAVIEELKRFRKKYGKHCAPIANRENRVINFMAVKYVGSWNEALREAGIEPARENWTRESLTKAIRGSFNSANTNQTLAKKKHPKLLSAGIKMFGSWKAALEASGLRYQNLRDGEEQWSSEKILARIRDLERRGELKPRSGYSRRHRQLYYAACDRFGSFAAARNKANATQE